MPKPFSRPECGDYVFKEKQTLLCECPYNILANRIAS